jgi:hypothetical protein
VGRGALALGSDVEDAGGSGAAVVDVDGVRKCVTALIWRVCLVLWLAVPRRLAVQRDDGDVLLAETLEMGLVSGRVSLILRLLGKKRKNDATLHGEGDGEEDDEEGEIGMGKIKNEDIKGGMTFVVIRLRQPGLEPFCSPTTAQPVRRKSLP